ncbi:4-hydroxybenzoate octaprenyltransferase [Rhodococcus erythropolis]|uniref:UbiA family prenyltransferase n=1 Tax=Rhodococcus erythropolis TaxID=1833 RepID=UPI001553534B|nr:UbiA family prenyltransferase [Rhodococcus erythropolis]PBI91056.1 4-hydroxybenzoate octaprenyltransferase [Rhodococcus erythropolis]
MRGDLLDYLTVSRARASASTSFPFFIGILISTPPLTSITIIVTWSTLLHYYICQLNNLADLDSDRGNPTRRPTPLTMGVLPLGRVRYWILIELFLLMVFGILPLQSLCAKIGVVALLLTVTYGNVYQKCSPRISPVIIDFLYGFSMGLPILIVGAEFGDLNSQTYWILSLCVGLNFTILNMFAGNMKDLEWDINSGCQTTAIELGVRPLAKKEGIQLTWSYRTLLAVTQIFLSIVTVAAIFPNIHPDSGAIFFLSLLAILATVGGFADILRRIRCKILRPPSGNSSPLAFRLYITRPAHAFLNLASVCAVTGVFSPNPLVSVAILSALIVGTFLLIAIGRRSAVVSLNS